MIEGKFFRAKRSSDDEVQPRLIVDALNISYLALELKVVNN